MFTVQVVNNEQKLFTHSENQQHQLQKGFISIHFIEIIVKKVERKKIDTFKKVVEVQSKINGRRNRHT